MERVAAALELQPGLVRSWMTPAPDARAQDNGAPVAPLRQPNPPPERAATDERSLLVRCISDPADAGALLAGRSLDELFGDVLHRRAAAHILDHPTAPSADLPADDHDLVSFMTGLLSTPAGRDAQSTGD